MLGPLLFILYVNEITDGVQSTLQMFADNYKLYRTIHNQHYTEILQQDLNFISNWSKLWLLNFNTTKCGVMHLDRNEESSLCYYCCIPIK